MARDERMKTNNDVVDAMHQVSENTSQRNKPGQERNQVCKTMNQHNDWQQERNQVCKNASQHNERWQEKMARDEKMKTNNDVVDAKIQVSRNTSY
jgi:hypothetical protein